MKFARRLVEEWVTFGPCAFDATNHIFFFCRSVVEWRDIYIGQLAQTYVTTIAKADLGDLFGACDLVLTFLGVMELARRWQWNLIKMEAEYMGNYLVSLHLHDMHLTKRTPRSNHFFRCTPPAVSVNVRRRRVMRDVELPYTDVQQSAGTERGASTGSARV
jgi:hypothetical protein